MLTGQYPRKWLEINRFRPPFQDRPRRRSVAIFPLAPYFTLDMEGECYSTDVLKGGEKFMYFQLLLLGLICLAAPVLARFAGYETRRKPFDLVGIGGIFFLLAASFGLGPNAVASLGRLTGLLNGLTIISFCLGWISLIVGAIWSTVEVIQEPENRMLHRAEMKA